MSQFDQLAGAIMRVREDLQSLAQHLHQLLQARSEDHKAIEALVQEQRRINIENAKKIKALEDVITEYQLLGGPKDG